MIYTIGYQKLEVSDLEKLTGSGYTIIDVRSRPWGRIKHGFDIKSLKAKFGVRYEWHGEILGGYPPGVQPKGLALLRSRAKERLMLLCQEEAPGDCHRHHQIAVSLMTTGIEVRHLYRTEVIVASSLQQALDDEDPEACYSVLSPDEDPLASLLATTRPS